MTRTDGALRSVGFAFPGRAEVIAHRGFSAAAPENTLAAIEAALAAGADAVEFDLHVTRDGVPVLFHDATLDRTTDGTGPLAARTLSELGALDAGSWFSADFAGEPIPTLEQALERTRGRVGRVYPELKGISARAHLDRIADTVVASGHAERVVPISMDWDALARLRERAPTLQVGYIVEDVARAERALDLAGGDPAALLDFDARILLADPSLVGQATERGIPLAVWTVDDPADATRLLELGVPRITTNQVEAMVRWKHEA